MTTDDLRLKVIITLFCSSGIRRGAWNYLKVKHLHPIKKGDITLAWMTVYAGQDVGKRRGYQTLISPEAWGIFRVFRVEKSCW
jgi:hypothetical protein